MKIPLDSEDDAKFEMAPMIDMVFLLLIFFMCSSHLSVVQNVQLEIPTAEHSVIPKERPDRFVVNITEEGTVYGGSQLLGNAATDPSVLDTLKDMVKLNRETIPGIRIYLRADKKTPHKHVKKVMGAMGEAGVDDFIFGAFKPSA